MRKATVDRSTNESTISVSLNIDGTGQYDIKTDVGFLKHMLEQISKHGLIDISVTAKGDLETGTHHTIEDTAIALGRAISKALGDRRGIIRMADQTCPLDEALTRVAIDMSGRGYAVIDMGGNNNIGEFPLDLARHFFESMAIEGKFCLHVKVLNGSNEHHVIESAFKAFARALRTAVTIDEKAPTQISSTKGTISS
ncbi:MAG: imidazoleglycerol-phosphate dehydratase HisB [SAR202 cluster bacterium]|nr:imidazoleglycerol-phosphate dehydratase [Chloroflexota bacterium]MDP6425830.1 imidazoleglycerol-phosphate dehydratase HisB [Dehalococcoidia bacterium]MDP7231770.1 imidazoleglycerol-phosphate dehydratase HisB [Dehalococcoidia bacterium]MDP7613668.1 imidazoleglycerol-phosphate dehydratase HisB [Dehalococcoidia bacterium]MQG47211.1 imidazoleglycerol-phosphate dehydratase HisB [SAR202 cluster bacterium]